MRETKEGHRGRAVEGMNENKIILSTFQHIWERAK